MNKDRMIDAISAIDQKYIIEYVQYETKLEILRRRKRIRTRSLIICAACLALVFCMLLVTLPLSFIVLGSKPVQEFGSQVIENVLFPLDQQPEQPDDPDAPTPPVQSLLQLNWIEWKFTEELFNALGAGTDDSVIDKLQSMQGNGLVGESMQDLGDFLARLYEYYVKHKDEIDAIIGEHGSESDTGIQFETETESDSEADTTTDGQTEFVTDTETEGSTDGPPGKILHNGVLYEPVDDGLAAIGCEYNPQDVVIPEYIDGVPVTEIAGNAFYNIANVESVYIPDTVVRIRSKAFYNCANLKTVNLPTYLELLGDSVFASCENLQGTIIIPKTLMKSGSSVFSGCTGLTEILLEDGLTQLFNRMFYGSSIKTMIVPDSITVITAGAFEECRELEYIVLPSGLKEIGDSAFHCCLALKEIEIPDGVERIGTGAFFECHSLTELYIPDSVHTIGSSALLGCTQLSVLRLPANLKHLNFSMIELALITTLEIPDKVEIIYERAVYNCPNLIRVDIPVSVHTIKTQAFQYLHDDVQCYYAGTMQEWSAVNVDNEAFLPGMVIVCTDGEIVIE